MLPRVIGHESDARRESQGELLARRIAKESAGEISRMEVKAPELLRATFPSSALRCCGRALWPKLDRDFFHASFQTEKISCFWSHSWHAASWKKVLLLMIVYKGQAAIVFGNIAALLGMLLFYLELLPSYPRAFTVEGAVYPFAPWGLVFGSCVVPLVLLVWQPKSGVFIDRICIDQSNLERKSAGLLSIGGILRKSESMLVLLDSSYPTRLWTVFELAAFLKSHGGLEDTSGLVIRPINLGPAAVFLFTIQLLIVMMVVVQVSTTDVLQAMIRRTAYAVLIMVPLVHRARGHFRWVEKCRLMLQNFTLEDAHSHCCAVQHLDDYGRNMVCDKLIMLECLRSWFRTEAEFESAVRIQVAAAFTKAIGASAFPFHWFVASSSCICWAFGDLLMARLRAGEYYYSAIALIMAITYPVLLMPFIFHMVQIMGYHFRARGSFNYLLSLVLGLALTVLGLLGASLRLVLARLFENEITGSLAWSAILAVVRCSTRSKG